MSRFREFTREELDAIRDGLLAEASLDPREDESFPERIAVAELLIAEIDET